MTETTDNISIDQSPGLCPGTIAKWAPPLTLLAAAIALGPVLPAWGWMWALAVSIFFACKWLTWWPHRHLATVNRHLAYFASPSMDAPAFLAGAAPASPGLHDWLAAAIKMLAGVALIWIVSRFLIARSPMLAGWSAMLGLVLLLHFGLLYLITLIWRNAGIDAQPLMRRPLRSTSLADLWGRRWNTGFSTPAHDLIFKPIARRFGPAGATAGVFVLSGLIHDAVISIPARGGCGLPTLYFLIQLCGLLIERMPRARRRLRPRWIGWLWVFVVAGLPLPLLFHEPFVFRVILPFVRAIGGV